MADVNQIIRVYGKKIRASKALNFIAENASTYQDAQSFASEAAEILCDVLGRYIDINTVTQEEAFQIFTGALKTNHEEVVRICAKVQQRINNKAKVGLRALTPSFNAEKARGLAMAITDAEEISEDYFRRLVVNNSIGVVDETIRKNAEAEENAGMVVHITRTYDDVGLHDGKEPCQWCLDREGEWDNYEDAYNAGAFERHPGCGCVITYEVGKTRTWANSAGTWKDM